MPLSCKFGLIGSMKLIRYYFAASLYALIIKNFITKLFILNISFFATGMQIISLILAKKTIF